jgi:hypothetical protein
MTSGRNTEELCLSLKVDHVIAANKYRGFRFDPGLWLVQTLLVCGWRCCKLSIVAHEKFRYVLQQTMFPPLRANRRTRSNGLLDSAAFRARKLAFNFFDDWVDTARASLLQGIS